MPMFLLSSAQTILRARHDLRMAAALIVLAAGAQQTLAQEAQAVAPAPRPQITQAVDETQLTRLTGNTHPLARPEFDLGTAPATLPMERMLLVLKGSPEQEAALEKLMDDQQDKNSPSYHKWLTPEEFGQKFGPTDADMQAITNWLQSHGFQVGSSKGRGPRVFRLSQPGARGISHHRSQIHREWRAALGECQRSEHSRSVGSGGGGDCFAEQFPAQGDE